MLKECEDAVQAAAKAAGRANLTSVQLGDIEARILATQRRLARTDPAATMTLTAGQRLQRAADQVMADIKHEADRNLENAQRQILITSETETRIQRLRDSYTNAQGHDGTRAEALKADQTLAYQDIAAVRREATGQLMATMEAAGDKQGAGMGRKLLMTVFDAENPRMTRDLVSEVFDNANGLTKNKEAQAGARAWLDTIEAMRVRFNAAGGDVRKLEYGYVPQPHDTARIRKAGADVWANKTLPLLDRRQYLNDDGSRIGDDQMRVMLRTAWETITTEGQNKTEPGQYTGTGKRANRGGDERQLHFADGDAYLTYSGEFGRGSMYDAMMAHVGGIARDIALVERYGPDPAAQMKLQFDLASRADGMPIDKLVGTMKINPQTYWEILSGKTGMPPDDGMARALSDVRNIMTAAKLGSAVISSFPDLGTVAVTAGYNRLPYWQLLKDIAPTRNRAEVRDFMAAHGMIAESLEHSMNRWSGDHLGTNWSGKMANSVMKWSLLNAWTDGLRQGFKMSMNAALMRMAKTPWANLDAFDQRHLTRAGFSEADWAVMNTVQPTMFRGRELLTPGAIRRADISATRPENMQRIKDQIKAQTDELTSRNLKEQEWIKGRIDKFDEARNALNRAVKEILDRKIAGNKKATEPLLQKMAQLDVQREQAQLHADMEADFNRFSTQDELRTFMNAVEDGASADKTAVGPQRKEVRRGLESAETIGRRYGEAKGRLDRRMREIEQRIAGMDRDALSAANQAGKSAEMRAAAMANELKQFIERSNNRQLAREAVVNRLEASENSKLKDESDRVKNQIATRMLGFVQDESEFAVVTPDIRTRAITTFGGKQSGTVAGEIARTTMQFKSFPIAMMTRHWARAMEGSVDGGPALANRYLYASALLLTVMGLGAVSVQTKQLLAGQDPIDMEKGRFWMKALAQGGGLGIAGDLFLIDPQNSGTGAATTLAKNVVGPSFGAASELLLKLGVENAWQASEGKDTHAAAEAAAWVKSNTPGASLWWAKPMIEHGFMNQLNENMSPGYLGKMKQRSMKNWGTKYWWDPKDATPSRAPDFENAVGQ